MIHHPFGSTPEGVRQAVPEHVRQRVGGTVERPEEKRAEHPDEDGRDGEQQQASGCDVGVGLGPGEAHSGAPFCSTTAGPWWWSERTTQPLRRAMPVRRTVDGESVAGSPIESPS